jgi:hypothetical protein
MKTYCTLKWLKICSSKGANWRSICRNYYYLFSNLGSILLSSFETSSCTIVIRLPIPYYIANKEDKATQEMKATEKGSLKSKMRLKQDNSLGKMIIFGRRVRLLQWWGEKKNKAKRRTLQGKILRLSTLHT